MKATNTRRHGLSLLRLFTLAGLALLAIGLVAATADRASAGESSEQLFSIRAKHLAGAADRIDIAFGKPNQDLKVDGVFALNEDIFTTGENLCFGQGLLSDHVKDVNAPPLINHEVWTLLLTDGNSFPAKCAQSSEGFVVFAAPVDPNNHLVIKEVTFYNTNGTPDVLDDDIPLGDGNAKKIDWAKVPRFANIFLCSQPSEFENCNSAALLQLLGQPVTTADPKCVGFPNFLPDAECPRQQIGSFEYEVRFDAKFVDVQLIGPYIDDVLNDQGTCFHIYKQGSARIACVSKGKDNPIFVPNFLSLAIVTPKPDAYSLLKANQENGIVVQLINQECNLSDLQGHPIPVTGLDVCQDGAVTIRYLEGDVHADCVIDVHDQQQIAFRWGSHLGQLLYNGNFDLEPSSPKLGDGDIDAKDLQTVFGRHESTCNDPHPAQRPIDPKAKVEPIPVPDLVAP